MAQLIHQNAFYLKHGLRNQQQFSQLPLSPWLDIRLPVNSVLHYHTLDAVDPGPSASDPIFKNQESVPLIQHVTSLASTKGNPTHLSVNPTQLVTDYQSKHRMFRLMKNMDSAIRNPNTLVVFNYNLINQAYKYTRTVYTAFHKWENLLATVFANVAKVVTESTIHHHYIVWEVPSVCPTIMQLDNLCKEVTSSHLEPFTEASAFNVFEMWRWLGKDRTASLISKIPKEHIHKVNIIYKDVNRWMVVNLGVLNSLRVCDDTDTGYVTKPLKVFDPIQLQKRMLLVNISIVAARTSDLASQVKHSNDDTQGTPKDHVPLADDSVDTDPMAQTPVDNNTVSQDLPSQTTVTPAEPELKAGTLHVQIDDDDTAKDIIRKEDKSIDEQLDALAEIAARKVSQGTEPKRSIGQIIRTKAPDLEEAFMQECDILASTGAVTAGEYRRFERLASAHKTLVAPNGQPMIDFIKIDPEDLKVVNKQNLKDDPTVLDKSMLSNTLMDMEKNYVEKILQKDIAACVMNFHRAGVAITGYKLETVEDYTGAEDLLTIKLAPIEGKPTTSRHKLPKIYPEGYYKANGVKYRLRKQRGEIPICKVGPDRVALTSYYGKTFINRGRRKVTDYGIWLTNSVMAKAIDPNDHQITNIITSEVFDGEQNVCRAYSALSGRIRSFHCGGYELCFDKIIKEKSVDEAVLKALENKGSVVAGWNGPKEKPFLVIDKNNIAYASDGKSLDLIGPFENFLGLQADDAPVECAELTVFGKDVPVGVILGYQMGLTALLSLLKANVRRVPAGTQMRLQPHEYAIEFSDESLILPKDDIFTNLVVSGFNEYRKAIRTFSSRSFDNPGVYLNLLESAGLSTRYLREIDTMHKLFIDPITLDILIEMKEPETFEGLLLRSCELLTDDFCYPAGDPRNLRDKGYERIAGAVYNELVQGYRNHNARFAKSMYGIEVPPYATWNRITQDPVKVQLSEINPVHALKELEAVTYSGTDGRNRRSMTKKTRAFSPREMGVTSESTSDSSDVGINFQVTGNPQYTSLRGLLGDFDYKKTGATSMFSTAALLAPGSDQDEFRRVNFVAIQQSHAVACVGYTQSPFRTGYETILGQRTSDLYCYTAKKPGKVLQINDHGIIVNYDDGSIQGYELGVRHGHAAGLVIPHNVVTPLKLGDKVEVGDCIVYNTGFFERDWMNKKRVVWKNAVMVNTVFWESANTHEDASAISADLGAKLETKYTKIKNITINFNQSVSNLVKPGQSVKAKDVLCYIEDSMTASTDLFSGKSIELLKALAKRSPKASVKGVVDKIEVLYHGDKEDMSDSLRAIADESDRQLKRIAKSTGNEGFTGAVGSGYRIENKPIALDTAVIRVYITASAGNGLGDKGVLFNQMKTVFSSVMAGVYRDAYGRQIDFIFGQKSLDDRIVRSPVKIATTCTLNRLGAKRVCNAYWGRK